MDRPSRAVSRSEENEARQLGIVSWAPRRWRVGREARDAPTQHLAVRRAGVAHALVSDRVPAVQPFVHHVVGRVGSERRWAASVYSGTPVPRGCHAEGPRA